MLPTPTHLEVRSHVPAGKRNSKPPLLFVHGGYCDAWCWEPYFLPWFAHLGYPAHALSLRGHGSSEGRDSVWITGLDDYAADVERVAQSLPSPPILIGHSMGAAVIERLLATRPLRAAALLAPVPPAGLVFVAARLATGRPDYLMHMIQLDPMRVTRQVLDALRPYYFSPRVSPSILQETLRHLVLESPRALVDLSLRLHWQLPERNGAEVLVLGAEEDKICTPDDTRATARHYGVEPVIVSGLAHMLMLEPDWQHAANAIAAWIAGLD